jgi:PAS domain S-box-containing protein
VDEDHQGVVVKLRHRFSAADVSVPRRRFDWLTAVIISVGLLAMALVGLSYWINATTFKQDAELIPLTDAIEQRITSAHLWVEESLAGDKSISVNRQVYGNVDAALGLVDSALEGGPSVAKGATIAPVKDKVIRDELVKLGKQIRQWRKDTRDRLAREIPSSRDAEYDTAFKDILATTRMIAADTDELVDQGSVLVQRASALAIVFLFGLFLALAKLARRSRRMIEARNAELERKVLERTSRLRESEQRTWSIVDSALDSVITMDAEGVITGWNTQAAATFGWPRNEAIGRPLAGTIIPEADRQAFEDGLNEFLTTGTWRLLDDRVETSALHRSGHEFPIELAVSVTRSASTFSFSAFARDITDRKRAERRRATQLEISRVIAASSTPEEAVPRILDAFCEGMDWSVGILWRRDPRGDTLRCAHVARRSSPGLEQFEAELREQGSPADKGLAGRAWHTGRSIWIEDAATDPELPLAGAVERAGLHAAFASPIRVGEETFEVLEFFSHQVQSLDAEILAMVTSVGGQIGQFAQRRRAEEERHEVETRYRTLVEQMPAVTYVKPPGPEAFSYVSPQIEGLLDYSVPEWQSDPGLWLRILHPDDRKRVLAERARTDQSGKPFSQEYRLLARDGHVVWVRDEAVLVQDATGDPAAWQGVFVDITERKRTEGELERAKDAAEAATRTKDEFLANMSHEIRTPLNAVIGMTELLLATPLSEDQLEYVDTVRTGGDALLAVINDILDFSKIEAGRMELEREPFEIRTCVEGSLDLVAPKAAEKGLDLAYRIDERTPPALIGDGVRVRQILVNMLSNAVKFTQQGEVVVQVSSAPVADGRHEVRFVVRDTGIGIPTERMDRLFKSFSQVDASTTRKYGGTGLGLAISKRLAEMMGGTMWVESREGFGSKFHFSIVAAAAPPTALAGRAGERPSLAGKSVLIVDDNASNRVILSLQVRSWGMVPHEAVSGEQALEWISGGVKFGVAILDRQMPSMDGLTLAREIRKLRDPVGLPLILLTTLGHRDEGVREIGIAARLNKPVKSSQLYDALVTIFASEPRTVAAAPAPTPAVLDSEMGRRHPLRILLAEDNEVNQKVALKILERLGYRASVAGSGKEAIEALERQGFDVVLMDVHMPEMDGIEATTRIRARWPADRQPRIIAMTANAVRGDRERLMQAGMDDYVSKPVKVEELVAALRRATPSPARSSSKVAGSTPKPTATAARTGGPVVDPAVLEQLRATMGEDPEAFVDVIGAYLEDSPKLLAAMREAAALGERDGFTRAAHTLKSSSATIGAGHLSSLCAQLESVGRAGSLAGVADGVARAEARYEQVRVTLERLLSAEPGQPTPAKGRTA